MSPEAELQLRRHAEIEAAWQLHTSPEHRIRRTWLSRHMEKQAGRCSYCNVVMKNDLAPGWHDLRATIDHIVARARGGADVEDNTTAACAACNLAKADMTLEEFLKHPIRLERLRKANTPPDRLCADPQSPFHDPDAMSRGVGVRFRGRERSDVEEYCVSEGWAKVPAGKSMNRRGTPLTVKLSGKVEAYFLDL